MSEEFVKSNTNPHLNVKFLVLELFTLGYVDQLFLYLHLVLTKGATCFHRANVCVSI